MPETLREMKSYMLKLDRQLKYYYLRFIRLRGQPNELALGMALGIFAGLLPILPFQTAFAITLAIILKGSKITAAIGTWVSNPFNWYFLYSFSYKIGASILGLSETNKVFASIMASIRNGEEALIVIGKIMGAGSTIIAAFLMGGGIMALVGASISYPIFLRLFQVFRRWRKERKDKKIWKVTEG